MPNHPSQDASLSGKLMFTRIPTNVMSSWWWRLHPATGFTSQHITPPMSVVSFAKNYPCLNLDDCGMVFSRFLQKGFGPLMAMLMGPGLKKKNIRMAAGRLIHATLEILKKYSNLSKNWKLREKQETNKPNKWHHVTLHTQHITPTLASRGKKCLRFLLRHLYHILMLNLKNEGGLSPPCPSICWVVSLPNMQSSPTRSDITFFIGDPHKPSFATSWEGGPSKSYLLCVSRLSYFFVVFAKGGMNILPSVCRILPSTIPIGNLL